MNLITVHNDEAKGGATMAVTAAEVMWIPSRNNCTTDTLYSLDLQRRCYSPVRNLVYAEMLAQSYNIKMKLGHFLLNFSCDLSLDRWYRD